MAVEFIGRVEHVLIRPKAANPQVRSRGLRKTPEARPWSGR